MITDDSITDDYTMVRFDPAEQPVLEDGDYLVKKLNTGVPDSVLTALENADYAKPDMTPSDQHKVETLEAEITELINENQRLGNDYSNKTSNRAIIQDLEQARRVITEIIELRKSVLADIERGGIL